MVALSFMGKKVHLVIRSTEMDDRRVLQPSGLSQKRLDLYSKPRFSKNIHQNLRKVCFPKILPILGKNVHTGHKPRAFKRMLQETKSGAMRQFYHFLNTVSILSSVKKKLL